MATLTEDDVLEQLDAQDNLFSFMKTAHTILLQGIRQFLPSLFVDNDEEIVEYAVKPLLAQSGPLDDIDVALRLIYALGKYETVYNEFLPCFCYALVVYKCICGERNDNSNRGSIERMYKSENKCYL